MLRIASPRSGHGHELLEKLLGCGEIAGFQWVAWYNTERLHSALRYVPPDEYEQAYWAQLDEAPQTA